MSIIFILNVVLGLFLTWSLLSLAAMQVQEWLAARMKWRSKMLEKSISKILTDPTMTDQFYNHPLIRSLFSGKDQADKPSYIPASTFSQAMIDILSDIGTDASLIQQQLYRLYGEIHKLGKKKRFQAKDRISLMLGMVRKALVSETGEEGYTEILDSVKTDLLSLEQDIPRLQPAIDNLFETVRIQKQQINEALIKLSLKGKVLEGETLNRVRAGITALSVTHPQLKQTLNAIINGMSGATYQRGGELDLIRSNIEAWFTQTMNRLSGWYKRRCLLTTLLVGVILAGLFNVDSINLTTRLWKEPDLRVALIENIKNVLTQNDTSLLDSGQLSGIQDQFSEVTLPVGWFAAPIPQSTLQSQGIPASCTFFPREENDVYGILVLGQCFPLINAPQVADSSSWLVKLIGLFLSGVASSPGASFWFDILKRFINVRLTGAKPSDGAVSAVNNPSVG